MTRRLVVIASLWLAACGDNHKDNRPDAGGSNDGGSDGGEQVCSRNLAESALAGGSYDDRFTIPGFTGFDGNAPTVFDFARDTDGSIVAAGEFQYLGSARVEPLLRWKNGTWMPARTTWELQPPGSGFSAVAIDAQGHMALATYDDFGPRSGQIWLDDGTGLRVIGEFDGLVRRLVWFGDQLWVGGVMTIDAATDIEGLARWTGTAWAPPPGGPAVGAVYELRVDGSDLLVGGTFTAIGGTTAKSAASYNGTTWTSLSFPNTAIYALVRDGNGVLYAGGSFGDQFGAQGGVAQRVGNTWQLLGGGLQNRFIVGVATDLAIHDGSLHVTGCFHTAGGAEGDPGAVVAQSIARYDGTWHSLDEGSLAVIAPWIQPLKCGDEGDGSVFDVGHQRLLSDGARLLVGGRFPGIAGVLSQAIVAHDGSAWTAQGPAGLGIGGNLDRIGASDTCDVYAYGERISHVGGVRSDSRVLHYTADGWEPIDDTIIPRDAVCTGFAVSRSGTAAVGCMIFPDVGDPEGRVYRVSGSELVLAVGQLPLIQTIAFLDDTLWIGGATLEGGGFLARYDGTTAMTVEDGFDGAVTLVDPVADNDVIVAGAFTKIGTLDALRVARRTDTAWRALGDGLPGTPTALAHDATRVYASTYDDGDGAYLLGAFAGTAWTELATAGSGLTPSADQNFNAIRVVGSSLVAVGTAFLDNDAGRMAVVYRNGAFTALGGGVGASYLSDIAITSDAIWIAGSIAEAGASGSLRSTVGLARYRVD